MRGHHRLVAEQQLAGADGGHQHRAALGHASQHGVVRERAVLDRVDARLDGVLDAAEGVAVRRDVLVVVVRDLDRCAQLVERELDRPRVLRLRREHRAGGHHLHEVGAVRELPTGRGAHGVGPVGDVVHARVVVGRRRGDREQLAREEQARAAQRTGADGVADVHLDVVPPADVADRGDAGPDGPLGRSGGVERDGSVAPARRLGRVAGVGGLRQVDVAVDQAGQQVRTRHVDHVVVARSPGVRADRGDAVTVDPDVGPTERARSRVVHVPTHQPAHGCGRYAIRT